MSNDSEFGVREIDGIVEFVAAGPWSPRLAQRFMGSGARRLILNRALGFSAEDLGFLRDLPVEELVVIDRHVRSLEPINELSSGLKALNLVTDPYLSIDLSKLPGLRRLGADWRQINGSIARTRSIDNLFVLTYDEPDLQPLAHLTDIESICFKDRPGLRSLEGLSAFPGLTHLAILGAANLTNIGEIESAVGLVALELQSCKKITCIDVLAACRKIRSLNISECGEIDSIRVLRHLSSLVELQLFGTTNVVDGDLSPLQDLAGLLELRMKERKHYRPSVAQIQAGLGR